MMRKFNETLISPKKRHTGSLIETYLTPNVSIAFHFVSPLRTTLQAKADDIYVNEDTENILK